MPALFNYAPDWFDHREWIDWHKQNWAFSLPLVAGYLVAVYGGLYWMSNRKPMDLKTPLIVWNSLLALLSTLGTLQATHETYQVIRTLGLREALCDNSFLDNRVYFFWGWLFVWSKVAEFGDTMFIVFRGKPVQFLHVYHHAVTCVCCFYYIASGVAICRWTTLMNLIVHSFMYTYFALVGMGFKIPRPLVMVLTASQLNQMLIGIVINVFHTSRLVRGVPCAASFRLAGFSAIVYLSYAVLFGHLFSIKYFSKSKSKSV